MKPSKANIASCISMSSTQGSCEETWASHPTAFLVTAHVFGRLYSPSAVFPSKPSIFLYLQFPEVSTAPSALLSQFHTLSSLGSWLWCCHICLPHLTGLLKSEWKPPWPHNSCFLHAWKYSTIWMLLRSSTSFRSSWAPVDHGYCSLWALQWQSIVKWIMWSQF